MLLPVTEGRLVVWAPQELRQERERWLGLVEGKSGLLTSLRAGGGGSGSCKNSGRASRWTGVMGNKRSGQMGAHLNCENESQVLSQVGLHPWQAAVRIAEASPEWMGDQTETD